MTFWQWFQKDGDQIFTFLSLLSLALKGVDGLPPTATTILVVVGIVANVAHRSFFPMPAEPAQPKVIP
jgi:hypothetical protein